MTEAAVENVDILIIGAGPVGLTLHLALAAGGQQSLLLDRRPLASQQGDPRALALSHGARQLLEQINSWPNRAATPIETIHISQKDGFGRTLIDHADYALPALGYVVRYRDLAGALAANLAPEAVRTEAEILDIAPGEEHVTVSLRHAGQVQTIRTKLLVHAEGTPGDDPAVSVSDYAQHAVICEVMPTPGHGNRAWERFTPDGPLALLPLGDEYSIVFTLPPAKADAVMALDDAAFIAALQQQFGQRAGLSRYAASRRLDRRGSAWFTDRIVRTFSNDFGPVKLARGLGLLALDVCPPARHFVAKRMIWGARAWP